MKVMETTGRRTGTTSLLLAGPIVGILLVALAYILSVRHKLRRASRPGREVSASISPSEMPLTTVTRGGRPGDPINIQFVGTDGQIGAAFAAAGWYRADEIDLVTSMRISVDSVVGRKYATAPVSNLYLYGHKEDMAFERPGRNVRQRDHMRIWKTALNGSDGRPIWIGSATKDTKVELAKTNHLPTHHIDSDVDSERTLVVTELAQTAYVVNDTTRSGFGKETHGFNGEGDPYFTDGKVAVLTLANVATPPLATQIRSPLFARMTKKLARFVHPWLPEAGRERAAREQARLKQTVQTNA